jgi:hypothetical protein
MAKAVKVSDPEEVALFIDKLPAQQQELVRLLREIILAADPAVSGHIKWNAPAFYYNGPMAAFDAKTYKRDILVMNLRQKDQLLLIFPTGNTIADSSGLLEGDYTDGRRMMRIKDPADAAAKKAGLQAVIRTWLAQVE